MGVVNVYDYTVHIETEFHEDMDDNERGNVFPSISAQGGFGEIS